MTYVILFKKNEFFYLFGKYYCNRENFSIGLWSNTSKTLGVYVTPFHPTEANHEVISCGYLALDFLSRNTEGLNCCQALRNLGVLF